MRTILFIAFATLLTAQQLIAKVAAIEFSSLVANCELIVVAKVESVSGPPDGKRYAKAKVTEVWKGTNSSTIEFLASPTWTCDISTAEKDETVLLFLNQGETSQSYEIEHSGHGRLLLRTVAGKSYVAFSPEVILPKGIKTANGPEPKWDSFKSVEVGTVRALVIGAAKKAKAAKR